MTTEINPITPVSVTIEVADDSRTLYTMLLLAGQAASKGDHALARDVRTALIAKPPTGLELRESPADGFDFFAFPHISYRGTSWASCDLSDAVFAGDWTGVELTACAVQRGAFDSGDLIMDATDFDYCDLQGAMFAECSLCAVSFTLCNLSGARFRDCALTGATFGGEHYGSDLTGAVFTNCDLRGVRMSDEQRAAATFHNCTF